MVFTGLAFAFISSPGRSLLVAAELPRTVTCAWGRGRALPDTTPCRRPAIRVVCVARMFPAAVRSRPPLAVAPFPPIEVIRPALSRVRRFRSRLTCLAGGRCRPLLDPPALANLPLLSRL